MTTLASGYMHRQYAESFGEWGRVLQLRRAGGWGLRRTVPGSLEADAMGCYPLLACEDWSGLAADLDEMANSVVAFSAVVDPLAGVTESDLRAAFPNVLRPFKEHIVVDLSGDAPVGSGPHRRKAERAEVDIERIEDPAPFLHAWVDLYEVLKHRHAITGMRAFSHAAFEKQLEVPAMRAVRTTVGGETVGMTLWAEHGGNVYYHLGAQNEAGYARAASYAMFDAAIAWFRERGCRLLDLGAAAGLEQRSDGLTRFKRGWGTRTVPAWFGGNIIDDKRYAWLTAVSGKSGSTYFPAYREGELG